MRPCKVIIVSKGLQSEQEKLFDLFEDCDIQIFQMNDYNMLSFTVSHRNPFNKVSKKILRIVLDDDLPIEEPNDGNIFTVLLTKPNDIKLELPELSPASFVSFHQCKQPFMLPCSDFQNSNSFFLYPNTEVLTYAILSQLCNQVNLL